MRKLFLALFCLLFLAGCQDGETPLARREIPNALTGRRALVLAHSSEYNLKFLEQLEKIAGRHYSVTIDDLSRITEYNFAYYNCVLIIERLSGGRAREVDGFMEIYNGANNIVLHALNGSYISPYPLSVVTADAKNTREDALRDTAAAVYALLKTK
ncbi:MAG: hypothetical protein LBD99_05620 [Candidatus Margulisbacteria bacterium]|jgi:hypothetical protein|nr:hypothetical protein [Candidatus Margulisiibacteriota bacterium]